MEFRRVLFRSGEKDGVYYHFVNGQAFRKMAGDGAFLEWAHVFGHRYGTPRAPVEAMLADGQDILFDIDWQGAQQLYQQAGGDVVRVFILPPSLRELERRLRSRATDRSEEHTSELQSLMRISYAVFCLKKKKQHKQQTHLALRHQQKNIHKRC